MKENVRKIVILNVFCTMFFLVSSTIFGVSQGFESYLIEVAFFSASIQHLILYLCALLCYAIGIEFLLRTTQEWLAQRISAWLAVLIISALYALSHLRHGLTGCIYALPIGIIGAILYQKWRDWKIFALWHIQWNFGTVGLFIFFTLLNVSPYSDAVSYTYKRTLMKKERIVYRKEVGWIDSAHYWGAQRRACQFFAALQNGESKLEITTTYKDIIGIERTEHFSISTQQHIEKNNTEKAKSLTLSVAKQEEATQATSSIWSGMRLSAWNKEDIRSVEVALHDITEDSFWNTCKENNKPMPQEFRPPKLEEDTKKCEAMWPSFSVFLQNGLP
jgi:hypothetical protein